MQINITARDFGGTEFLAQPHRLHLGAQKAEGVDRLEFSLPEQWNGCVVTLHIRHADGTLAEQSETLYDAVVLPGGPQGSVNLAANKDVIRFISAHDAAGKLICPICSAAARVLGGNNLLKGRRYVCSGDLFETVKDGKYVDAPVVEDGNLLSGKGLGHAFDFALTLSARLLNDEEAVRDHADHIYYAW